MIILAITLPYYWVLVTMIIVTTDGGKVSRFVKMQDELHLCGQ